MNAGTHKTYILLTLWMLMVWPSTAAAQFGSLKGTVVDEVGRPVAYVSIIIVESMSGRITNENGEFFVPVVPLGSQVVKVRAEGYKEAIANVLIVNGGVAEVDFVLEPGPPSTRVEAPYRPRGARSDSIQAIIDSVSAFWRKDEPWASIGYTPLRHFEDLELQMDYALRASADTVTCTVTAKVTNTGSAARPVCGQLVCILWPAGLDDFEIVSTTPASESLSCRAEALGEGRVLLDELRFSADRVMWGTFGSGISWEKMEFPGTRQK